MTTDLGTVQLRFEAEMGALRSDLDQLRGNLGKTEKKGKSLTSSLKKVGLALGGLYAVKKVGGFLWDATSAASDFAESLDKSSRVFETSHKTIEKWSKNAAKTMGMSNQKAIEAAAGYGNLLNKTGATTEASAEMSMSMVQLAADLAAFNNVPTEEALIAIRSGLTGEMEPMKRFGVLLDQDRLKLRAMEMGLYSGKGALDANVKSLVAYEEMLAQTSEEQGNFVETAGGLAGQKKTLEAMWDELKIALGEALIGPMTQFATWLTRNMPSIIEWFRKLGRAVAEVVGYIEYLAGGGGFGDPNLWDIPIVNDNNNPSPPTPTGPIIPDTWYTAPVKGTEHTGLDYVPTTGNYLLSKGESVLTGSDSVMMQELAEALSGGNAAVVDAIGDLRSDTRRARRTTLTRPTLIGSIGVA